jgi:hypothetical protein
LRDPAPNALRLSFFLASLVFGCQSLPRDRVVPSHRVKAPLRAPCLFWSFPRRLEGSRTKQSMMPSASGKLQCLELCETLHGHHAIFAKVLKSSTLQVLGIEEELKRWRSGSCQNMKQVLGVEQNRETRLRTSLGAVMTVTNPTKASKTGFNLVCSLESN